MKAIDIFYNDSSSLPARIKMRSFLALHSEFLDIKPMKVWGFSLRRILVFSKIGTPGVFHSQTSPPSASSNSSKLSVKCSYQVYDSRSFYSR